MIIYNISFTVAPSFMQEWEVWSKEYLGPKIMETGFFDKFKTLKVLSKEANEYPVYCLQFTTDSIYRYTQYNDNASSQIKAEVSDKYKDQVLFFDSVLKEMN